MGRGLTPRAPKARRQYAKGRRAWGISERGGQRELLSNLIEDGQYPGLKVTRAEFDPRHPQEFPVRGSDAQTLKRPSPERDRPNQEVRLPAPRPDNIGELNWLPGTLVSTGILTLQVTVNPANQLEGNQANVSVGTLAVQTVEGEANAFLSGNPIGVAQGSLVGNSPGSGEITPAGNQASVSVGTLSVESGTTTEPVGNQVNVAVGTLVASSPLWMPSTLTQQFDGASLRTVGQKP